MAIPELIKFREKYPQYSDISDSDLANKLAQKYSAYKDLPEKLSSFQGGATSPANVQAQQSQKQAEFNAGPIAMTGQAVKSVAEPAGVMANSAMFGVPGVTSELLSGGKLVNPLTHGLRMTEGGTNVFEGKDMSSGQQLAAGLAGAVAPAGAIGKIAGKAIGEIPVIKSMVKYSKPSNQVKLAEEVQNGLMSQKRAVIDKYGKEYESIVGKSQNKVDLSPAVKNFVDEAQSLMQNPEFSQQVAAKNPQAMRIFDMTDKISKAQGLDSISAKEADNLSKYIRNLPSIKSKLNQAGKQGWHTVQWTNEDRMFLGLADDIKGSVIQAHPELGALNKDYGQFMNSYKNIAPDFKIGTTINKLKNYGQLDPQKQALFENIMPKTTVARIKQFEQADKTVKMLQELGLRIGKGAAYGLGGAAVGGAAVEAYKNFN